MMGLVVLTAVSFALAIAYLAATARERTVEVAGNAVWIDRFRGSFRVSESLVGVVDVEAGVLGLRGHNGDFRVIAWPNGTSVSPDSDPVTVSFRGEVLSCGDVAQVRVMTIRDPDLPRNPPRHVDLAAVVVAVDFARHPLSR